MYLKLITFSKIVTHFYEPQNLNCLRKKNAFPSLKITIYGNSSLSMKCPVYEMAYL